MVPDLIRGKPPHFFTNVPIALPNGFPYQNFRRQFVGLCKRPKNQSESQLLKQNLKKIFEISHLYSHQV